MTEEKFTTRIINGLRVSKRIGDGRIYCKQCGIAMDIKGGGCASCKPYKGAWRQARIQNYIETRSVQALAQMVVELEDSSDSCPEFGLDEEWPERVRHLKAAK
jgi:hypothetical protein